jgi:hypothetical protein
MPWQLAALDPRVPECAGPQAIDVRRCRHRRRHHVTPTNLDRHCLGANIETKAAAANAGVVGTLREEIQSRQPRVKQHIWSHSQGWIWKRTKSRQAQFYKEGDKNIWKSRLQTLLNVSFLLFLAHIFTLLSQSLMSASNLHLLGWRGH